MPILPAHNRPHPDFEAFARALTRAHLDGLRPLRRAEHLLLENSDLARARTPKQRRYIRNILRNARQIDGSLTHRVFQELVLGSEIFAETYDLPPVLDTESFLLRYDRSMLPASTRTRLLEWLGETDHRAVIFTSRPSRTPDGEPGTPEAEIGTQGVGLEALPLVGLGSLTWLSARRKRDREFFLKPSPVHALTALRMALGDRLEDGLQAAAALVLDDQSDPVWQNLGGAQVYVFEDGVAGLQSITAAQEILEQAGVSIKVHLFGVATSTPKGRALQGVGATVTPALTVALEHVPGFRPHTG